MEEDDYVYNLEDVGNEGLEDDTIVEMVIVAPSEDRIVLVSESIYSEKYRVHELSRHRKRIKEFMQLQRQSIQKDMEFFAQFK